MKVAMFSRTKGKIKWGFLFETIKINLQKGNLVVIGSDKQIKKIKKYIFRRRK